jgi:hypothetical protein
MKMSEALIGARAQIAWILALALSTAAIIHLERLDIGTQAEAKIAAAKLEDARLFDETKRALAEAESRFADAPGNAVAAASLLLALSNAVEAGALGFTEGRMKADDLWVIAAKAGPEWTPAIVAAGLTFSR